MTRKEAEEVIQQILSGAVQHVRPRHFWESVSEEGFTVQDVNAILRSHTMLGAPEWKPNNSAFRVRLRGKCLEGRITVLVVDLRVNGPCALVTIIVDNATPRAGKAR